MPAAVPAGAVVALPQEYQAFVASPEGAAALGSTGASGEEALAKMRLLALMGLAHGVTEITFDQIEVCVLGVVLGGGGRWGCAGGGR